VKRRRVWPQNMRRQRVSLLLQLRSFVTKSEHHQKRNTERMDRAANEARVKSEQARLALEVLIPLMWALDSGDVGRASERSDAGWFLQ
jgi:hypothetical protein